jgi:predicted amidohydrolase YtcJ
VVVNARVHTVDAAPAAGAGVRGAGRPVHRRRTSADIRALAGPKTQLIDAKGMTVVPGFIDCHNHAAGEVLLYEVLVGNPFEVEFVEHRLDRGEAEGQGRDPAAGHSGRGRLLDDTKVRDGRLIKPPRLDQVSTQHPVIVRHLRRAHVFYNSKVPHPWRWRGSPGTPNPPAGNL